MSRKNPRETSLAHLKKSVRLARQLYAIEKQSPYGPIETERFALGLDQLLIAQRLGTPPQNLNQFLQRLKRGAVTIKSIRKVADSIGCDCLVAIVPRGQSSLEAWVKSAKVSISVAPTATPAQPLRRRKRFSRAESAEDNANYFQE